MARRCVSDGSPGRCCQAFSQGVRSGQNFTFTDSRGHTRCASCSVIQRTKGRGQGFRFRFVSGQACGIVSGCAALRPGGAGGLTLPQGGGVPTLG